MGENDWSFASILKPIDPETFRTGYWGSRELHVARGRADFYGGLITLEEIERHLTMPEFFSRHSISTPQRGYGAPDPPPGSLSEARQRLFDGKSLRIRRMECFLDPASPAMCLIRDMVNQIQHSLESLSCYIGRAGAAGLGPHHDETEIFTLQISGRKRWRLYHQTFSHGSGTYDPQRLAKPSRELVLEAGDLLYIPRGLVHDVTAEEGSFSLTVVFDPFTWHSLLDVLSTKLAGCPEFLSSMPAGEFTRLRRPDELRRALDSRLGSIRERLESITADDVTDLMAEKLFARMMWPPSEQLQSMLDLEMPTLDTVLERRAEVPFYLARRGDQLRLILPGGYAIQVNARAEAALRNVLETSRPFRVATIHESLNSEAKLALAGKLLGCGLLKRIRQGEA